MKACKNLQNLTTRKRPEESLKHFVRNLCNSDGQNNGGILETGKFTFRGNHKIIKS